MASIYCCPPYSPTLGSRQTLDVRTGEQCDPPNEKHLFGFVSLDQLRAGFSPDELEVLRDYGYRVVEHEGTLVQVTDTQCTFEPEDY